MKKIARLFIAAALCCASAWGKSVPLDGEWWLSYWPQPTPRIENPKEAKPEKTIKAKMPGNVEIDMLAAGEIAEPRFAKNVYKLRKYEGYQWLYSRTFTPPKLGAGERAILNLRGVDTLAGIFINGKNAGSTDNMLVAHKIDITDFLKDGENKIEILLSSAVIEAFKHSYPMGCTLARRCEGLEIRKAPHMFGRDIMPRLVSAGIWKSVSVDVQKPERIEDVFWFAQSVYPKAKTAKMVAFFRAPSRFEKFDDLRYNIILRRGGKTAYQLRGARTQTNCIRALFTLENAEFWWPRTMGGPALHEATIELADCKKWVKLLNIERK